MLDTTAQVFSYTYLADVFVGLCDEYNWILNCIQAGREPDEAGMEWQCEEERHGVGRPSVRSMWRLLPFGSLTHVIPETYHTVH